MIKIRLGFSKNKVYNARFVTDNIVINEKCELFKIIS